MAKQFDSFTSFGGWLQNVSKKAIKKSNEDIAREWYKDSEKYTYIDTKEMYNSGKDSDFKNGYVVIKAPQVRWLYYTASIQPRHNMSAVPQWFEATKAENIGKYKNIYINNFNKYKKEV